MSSHSRTGSRAPRTDVRVRAAARRLPLAGTLALLMIASAACFDRPIDEEMEIRFPARGGLVASSSVRIAQPEAAGAALEERLARARRELEAGNDAWSPELAALDPLSERVVVDRRKGEIVAAVHRIYVRDRSDLRKLLARAAGSVRLSSGEGWSEVTLSPLVGSRAGASQRRRSAALVEDWSERIARYFESVEALYRYLDANPERAEICLEPLVTVEAPAALRVKPPALAPSDEENALIEPVQDAMKDVVAMFDPDEDSAFTPDEIVRLANDPFPTRLAVVVPGKVLESEGFLLEKEGDATRLAVPEGGLFGAITALEGTWIAPDPLVAFIRQARSRAGEPVDVAAFAALPRTARSGATPSAVRRDLERGLAPASSYRVKWASVRAPAPAADGDGTGGGAASENPPSSDEGPDDIDWDALTARR